MPSRVIKACSKLNRLNGLHSDLEATRVDNIVDAVFGLANLNDRELHIYFPIRQDCILLCGRGQDSLALHPGKDQVRSRGPRKMPTTCALFLTRCTRLSIPGVLTCVSDFARKTWACAFELWNNGWRRRKNDWAPRTLLSDRGSWTSLVEA